MAEAPDVCCGTSGASEIENDAPPKCCAACANLSVNGSWQSQLVWLRLRFEGEHGERPRRLGGVRERLEVIWPIGLSFFVMLSEEQCGL